MDFQQKLINLKERLEGNLPADALKIMHGATKELQESGIQERVLMPGQEMPAFELLNQNKTLVNSGELLTKGALIITFYRGIWCPYCNVDLANLKKYLPQVEAAGAQMVAISPEKPVFLKKISDMQKLNFDLLHDVDNVLADLFGLKFYLPEALREVYREKFSVDLQVQQGNNNWALPMPARFLVDSSGIIQYAESEPDYRQRPDPDELIQVLKSLQPA